MGVGYNDQLGIVREVTEPTPESQEELCSEVHRGQFVNYKGKLMPVTVHQQ